MIAATPSVVQTTDAPAGRLSAFRVGLLVVPAVLAFGLFAYNSGYGYDQLEYLVIGRAWARGIPFYTYIPSKSFGIFALVAVLSRLGVGFGHASLALVIAGVFASVIGGTYLVVKATSDDRAAVVGLALVAASAAFMEMNFLQPEAFVSSPLTRAVQTADLGSFHQCSVSVRRPSSSQRACRMFSRRLRPMPQKPWPPERIVRPLKWTSRGLW